MKKTLRKSLTERVEESLTKLVGRIRTVKGVAKKLEKQGIKGRRNVCPLHVYLSRSLHIPARNFSVGARGVTFSNGNFVVMPTILQNLIKDVDNGVFPKILGKWSID